MKLAIFDIDGTLTLGDRLGTRLFFRAFAEVYGLEEVDRRLSGYAHSTDSGIAREVLERAWRRDPLAGEIETVKSHYLDLLARALEKNPGAYRQVAGASAALTGVGSERGWKVALASGNWRRAGMMKLESAGIAAGDHVGAFAEDGLSRAEVVSMAVQRALREAGGRSFGKVVYIGDRNWDVETAVQLGIDFLGVASGGRRDELKDGGACSLVSDYDDYGGFFAALRDATGPATASRPIRRAAGEPTIV